MPVRHLELATTTTTTTATTATLIESDGRRSTIGRWGRRPPPQKGRGPAHQEERRGRGRCLCVCVCVCVSVFSSVCVAYRSTVSTATAVVAAPPARPLRFVHPVSVRACVRPCVLGFSLTADEITERERERECVPQAGRHVGPAPQRVFLVAHRYVEPPQEPVHKIKKKKPASTRYNVVNGLEVLVGPGPCHLVLAAFVRLAGLTMSSGSATCVQRR